MKLTFSTLPKTVQFMESTQLKNFYDLDNLRSIHRWRRKRLVIHPPKSTSTDLYFQHNVPLFNDSALGYSQCGNIATLPYLIRRSNYNNHRRPSHSQLHSYGYYTNFAQLSHRLISYYANYLTTVFTISHSIYLQLTNISLFKLSQLNTSKTSKSAAKSTIMLLGTYTV